MEFGLQVINTEFSQLRDIAQGAEQLGFDLITFPDHVVFEGPGGQYDPRDASFDPFITAAVVAEATSKIRIGHLVLCNLFRHPVFTAQSLMTLDHLSRGRVIAGVGAGWTEREFRMTGIVFPEISTRLRMLDEALACIRSLWTNEQSSFEGDFYTLREAILAPKPVQKPHPPILIGGAGRGMLRIAAKHANYLNIVADVGKVGTMALNKIAEMTDAAFKEKVQFVRAEARKFGRNPDAIALSNAIFTVMLTDSPNQTDTVASQFAAAMGLPKEAVSRSPLTLIGTPEQCTVELRRRAKEWGVSQFIFSGGSHSIMQRLAEEVIPHVR